MAQVKSQLRLGIAKIIDSKAILEITVIFRVRLNRSIVSNFHKFLSTNRLNCSSFFLNTTCMTNFSVYHAIWKRGRGNVCD